MPLSLKIRLPGFLLPFQTASKTHCLSLRVAMSAPAALSLGSCAGLPPGQGDKGFLSRPKLSNTAFHLHGRSQAVAPLSSRRPPIRPAPLIRAVAVDSDQLGSTEPAEKESAKKYYFVVANAKFMLDEEEHFKELMFERLRMYGERNKEQDFWLVIEPKFLNKFPNITKRLKRPAVALVSTNGPWITFMKLRLDRVLAESYEADNLEEALASNPADLSFEKPENWVAPYPKYEYGWWESFLPPVSKEAEP